MIKMDRRRALKVAGNYGRGQHQQKYAGEQELLHHGATIPEMPRRLGAEYRALSSPSAAVSKALTLQALPSG
jgi:hypothetical protein